ncbi:MAG: hypothetical protein KKD35_02095 [Elusimicrobia bacterium]|nr:hypothetical protein [Elusimicrobiota bacterium]
MIDRFDQKKIRSFYEKYFQTEEGLNKFIERSDTEHMKLLVYWLVGIADSQELVVENRSGLKIFFMIVLAESIAKMADNYKEEGLSRKYAKDFFKNADTDDQKNLLEKFIYTKKDSSLNIDYIADFFYSIRCDLAHNGIFWRFFFNSDVHDATVSIKSANFGLSVMLKYDDFKYFIVKTAIKFINEYNTSICQK